MINQRDIIDWKQKRMEGYESGPEIPLIQSQNIDHQAFGESSHREEIVEELKRQLRLALPLIAVSFLQYCLQVISIMFVGHLGELPLSSASIATSLASVTGFSVLGWGVHWKRYVGNLTELKNIICSVSIHREGCLFFLC